MIASGGNRLPWSSLPGWLLDRIGGVLGSSVVSAVSQSGGFSPGSADRVVLADGRRAFVKAVDRGTNPRTVEMHRAEAQIAAVLPPTLPVPRFLGVVDENDWVAVCFADVDGRHPAVPWTDDDVVSTLELLAVVAGTTVAAADLPHPPAETGLAEDFRGFERLAADLPPTMNPLAAAHLDELRGWARGAAEVCRGDALCHLDVRADNLLIDDAGRMLLVDWPWATLGAPWIDTAAFLVNVGLYGGQDPEVWVDRSPLLRVVPPDDLTAFLAGMAGMFLDAGRHPPSPGMTSLRRFQRDQGDVVVDWLAARFGW